MFVRKLLAGACICIMLGAEAAWSYVGRTDPEDPRIYVSFDANGGSGQMGIKVMKDAGPMKLPACPFVRPGYVFVGWCGSCENCEEGGDCWHRPRDTVQVRGDRTYRALWRKLWSTQARNYSAWATDEEGRVGALIFVKAGRPSTKTGVSSISATILQPYMKKVTLKGRTDSGVVELSAGSVRLELVLTDHDLTGTLSGHPVTGAPVPNLEGSFTFGAQEVSSTYEGSWISIPEAVPFSSLYGNWSFPRKTKLHLDDGNLDPCSQSVNPWGVKLKYTSSSGKFTGSYTLFRGMGGGVGLVAGAKCSVTGVMVNGQGRGWALSKVGDEHQVYVW